MQSSVPHLAEDGSATRKDRARTWTRETLSTSEGEIVARQSAGKRLPVFLLGPLSVTSPVDEPPALLAHGHGLIEIQPAAGAEAAFQSTESYANLVVEALELLGIEQVVALDRTGDGRIGLELMTVFTGLVGLAIVGAPQSPGEVGPTSQYAAMEDGTPILQMPSFDPRAFDDFMEKMEARAAELTAAPPLWYGG